MSTSIPFIWARYCLLSELFDWSPVLFVLFNHTSVSEKYQKQADDDNERESPKTLNAVGVETPNYEDDSSYINLSLLPNSDHFDSTARQCETVLMIFCILVYGTSYLAIKMIVTVNREAVTMTAIARQQSLWH